MDIQSYSQRHSGSKVPKIEPFPTGIKVEIRNSRGSSLLTGELFGPFDIREQDPEKFIGRMIFHLDEPLNIMLWQGNQCEQDPIISIPKLELSTTLDQWCRFRDYTDTYRALFPMTKAQATALLKGLSKGDNNAKTDS